MRIKNNRGLLSNIPSFYYIKKVNFDSYNIELAIFKKKKIGISKNNKILVNKNNEYKGCTNFIWKLINIYNDFYMIKNEFNNKFIFEENNYIKFININHSHLDFNIFNNDRNNKYMFKIIKVFNEANVNKKYLKIVQKEPVDILMKYIDLTDKNLNRVGFNQTYKDFDNEELKFSLRSILSYIPWIRKIFILMPNKKVNFLKNIDEINEKIIYVRDKDLLGFDSSNIQSFLFSLEKMKNFGLSTNFIYMEDDCFIGSDLEKKDFFYYDEKIKKIKPYLMKQ